MESESKLTQEDITKYNISAKICSTVYKELKKKIMDNEERNLKNLSDYGNNRIKEELSKIYKKDSDKNIAFPVSISLNDIISNYVYDYKNEESIYNNIKDTDIVKIELGVSVCGYISMIGETFTIIENKPIEKVIKFLNKIQKDILEMIKDSETVDEVRIFIESQCTNLEIFPIENCTSYQHDISFIKKFDSKYMLLNYKPKYDYDDYLITFQNINFEFEEDDIFTINLTVLPIEDDNDTNIKYKLYSEPHIYRLNDYNYSLKVKSSREFYNNITLNHSKYAFEINEYLQNAKNRIGLNECTKNNIIDSYPIITTKNKLPVITKKFTIIVGKHNSKLLKY